MAGYVFAGWFTTKTGGEAISPDTTITENRTYYAHWVNDSRTMITFRDNIPITVTFDNNID